MNNTTGMCTDQINVQIRILQIINIYSKMTPTTTIIIVKGSVTNGIVIDW